MTTAKQTIRKAKMIRVVFGLMYGEATVWVSKKEALRLIQEHELTTISPWENGGSDSGSFGTNEDGTIMTISFLT